MDHVINSLQEWLRVYDDEDSEGWKDENAIECIENALEELSKYYTHYNNV